MEGANSRAEVPTSNAHPPDPTHSSVPNSFQEADKDMGAPDPYCDMDMKEGEEPEQVDMVIEEEYEEELDYEDDEPTNEQPANISRYKAKCPGIWNQLGDQVHGHVSTDTETSETATMMENVLGIQSPEGAHGTNKRAGGSNSYSSDWQHTVLSDASLEATDLTPPDHQVTRLAAKQVSVVGNIKQVGHRVQKLQIDWMYLR